MKSTIILLITFFAFSVASLVEDVHKFEDRIDHLSWFDYKGKFGKSYENKAVEMDRMRTFLKNKDMIRKHNEDYAQGKESYWLDLNKFADITESEMRKYNGLNLNLAANSKKNSVSFSTILAESNANIPEEIDWRELDYVTDVKDQASCGSCWAFSATGALEGQNKNKTGKLVSLSEQNLIDCSIDNGNDGCEGGVMDYAFHYVIDNKGIDTEDSYPYDGMDKNCRYNAKNKGGTASQIVDIKEASEVELKAAVGIKGPVSIAFDAGFKFSYYKGGVYRSKYCSTTNLNHGILVVGYGKDKKNGEYWIVKNSWGEWWGEKGYVRVARNEKNMCGIATAASYPIV